jgi:D-lactate dehydrogenase
VAAAGEVLHAIAPALLPELPRELALPRPAPPLARRRIATRSGREAVYFPTCLTRVVGPLPGEPVASLSEAVLETLEAAGWAVRIVPRVEGLCCGVPFASKGFPKAAREASQRAARAAWACSDQGRLPILTDASPCAAQLDVALGELAPGATVLDFTAFWARHGLPHVERLRPVPGEIALHPTCTLQKAGGLADLRRVAEAHAERVFVPAAAECCGFAGDRGFLVPEVTAAATRREAAELREGHGGSGCFSTCRTCEIGLTRATGRPWRHVAELVRESLQQP